MLNHICKFGRVLDNVGQRNPVITATAVVMVVLPLIVTAIGMVFQMPVLVLQVVVGVVVTFVLGITAKRIYEEYKGG